MTEDQLQQLGLPPSQAKAYILLVREGKLTPNQLVAKTGESRTNAYMVLDKLVQLGLAYKDDVSKKLVYRVSSPVGLQKLAERQRAVAFATEAKIREAMPQLLKFFHEHRTQPGVRFLQGRAGLKEVYQDHLKTGGDICVFRTPLDESYYGDDLYGYMEERAKRGIKVDLISPHQPGTEQYHQENLPLNREMTWIPEEAYTAPVEISMYNSRVAITSFGEEAVAMLIESPQIAQAMREIFAMAKVGAGQMLQKRQTDTNNQKESAS